MQGASPPCGGAALLRAALMVGAPHPRLRRGPPSGWREPENSFCRRRKCEPRSGSILSIMRPSFRSIASAALLAALSLPLRAADIQVACVGNSITAGYGLAWHEDYPTKLDSILGTGYAVTNYGNSGKTMVRGSSDTYWSQTQFANALAAKPDIVVIELGTNDSKTYIWPTYGKDFKADYRAMVDTFRTSSPKPEVWITLQPRANKPSWNMYDSTIAKEINPLIRAVALEAAAPLIDLRAGFAGHPEWYLDDSVHPNAVGAIELAKLVAGMLTRSPVAIKRETSGTLTVSQGCGFQWYRNGVLLPGDTAQTLKSTLSGSYKVSVKVDAATESRLVSSEATMSVGVSERSPSTIALRVGSSGRLEIQAPADAGPVSVLLRDSHGKTVSVGSVRSGVYLYELSARDVQQKGRLVVP